MASGTRFDRRRGSGSTRPSVCSRSARRPSACSRRSPAAGPLKGRTELFITPGFEFRRVDHLLTNFHLPRSTLLALVMAFAGVEETRRLYRLAIEERYRFYSFGDAMLMLSLSPLLTRDNAPGRVQRDGGGSGLKRGFALEFCRIHESSCILDNPQLPRRSLKFELLPQPQRSGLR